MDIHNLLLAVKELSRRSRLLYHLLYIFKRTHQAPQHAKLYPKSTIKFDLKVYVIPSGLNSMFSLRIIRSIAGSIPLSINLGSTPTTRDNPMPIRASVFNVFKLASKSFWSDPHQLHTLLIKCKSCLIGILV